MSDNANQPLDYNQPVKDLIPAHQSGGGGVAVVSPYDTVLSAFARMVTYDYSQLPVVSDGRVIGVVKWNALAVAVCHTGNAAESKIQEYVEKPPRTIGIGDQAENAIAIVADGDYTIAVNEDGGLAGIITASDMAVHLHALAEPHANIQRIEMALREINNYCRKENGKVPSIGEQIEKLNRNWCTLCTELDRDEVVSALEKAKDTRDDLAHFKPGIITESDRENLRRCAARLESIRKCQPARCRDRGTS